jgi:hypothetical protein
MQFVNSVPPILRPYNGRQFGNPSIPGDVLELFRLTRDIRQAFISYKRTDSQTVADQLFDALTRRGYRMFLDTASVNAAATFQEVLMDRLADMDLVIFLDSPNVQDSEWVLKEFTRANTLNLGMLQLIWPKKRRHVGSDFAEPFELESSYFKTYTPGPRDELQPSTVAEIVDRVEQVRIKSLGLRRKLVVGELTERATRAGLDAVFQPAGPVEIKKGKQTIAMAIPILGLPDAWAIHHAEKQLRKYWRGPKAYRVTDRIKVFYDGLGIQPERAEHLVWLNDSLKLRTATFEREQGTAADPLERWLDELGPWWRRALGWLTRARRG